MPSYTGEVTTPKDVSAAFAYMADFTHTSEWDPNCESADRVSGDGGVGTRYKLRFSGVAGQEMELDYEVTEYDAPHRFVLEGGNDSLHSVDTIEVEPHESGAKVTYKADLELKGIKQLGTPILAMGLQKAGSDAKSGLEEKLNPPA